ncbi:MAG TPA: HlyD family efflux transporter periplasmic adaptor subunit [Polyangiaceae bacterium]|nr:HlyD family efflux transporter periplasmic adaptor subunit [Polyangiaceae bacterium]
MIKNAAALLLAFAAVGCAKRSEPPPGYQGVVELDERVVAAEVSGRVTRVAVHRGDPAASGALLATLDDSLARLARDARAHEAEAARAELALLRAGARREDLGSLAAQARAAAASQAWLAKNVERARALRDAGAVPEGELDRAEAELARSTAEHQALEQRVAGARAGARPQELARAAERVAALEATLALEDARLARYSVRSGSAGGGEGGGDAGAADATPSVSSGADTGAAMVVLETHVEPGELAGVGAPIATLGDTLHPYVDVFVPQAKLGPLRVGHRGTLRVDASTEAFPCAVEHVSRATEFTPRFLFSERERANLVVRVRVRVDDPARRLHAGVPAFVELLP